MAGEDLDDDLDHDLSDLSEVCNRVKTHQVQKYSVAPQLQRPVKLRELSHLGGMILCDLFLLHDLDLSGKIYS